MPPRAEWWVIHSSELLAALERVQAGEDAEMVFMELYANSDAETVDGR